MAQRCGDAAERGGGRCLGGVPSGQGELHSLYRWDVVWLSSAVVVRRCNGERQDEMDSGVASVILGWPNKDVEEYCVPLFGFWHSPCSGGVGFYHASRVDVCHVRHGVLCVSMQELRACSVALGVSVY